MTKLGSLGIFGRIIPRNDPPCGCSYMNLNKVMVPDNLYNLAEVRYQCLNIDWDCSLGVARQLLRF